MLTAGGPASVCLYLEQARGVGRWIDQIPRKDRPLPAVPIPVMRAGEVLPRLPGWRPQEGSRRRAQLEARGPSLVLVPQPG